MKTDDPWKPIRCPFCETILRGPGDEGCEDCEFITETMQDARDEAICEASLIRGERQLCGALSPDDIPTTTEIEEIFSRS